MAPGRDGGQWDFGGLWSRPVSDFAAVIDVATLDGTTGAAFIGSLSNAGNAGYSLAFADVNGDGVDDLIIGAPFSGSLQGTVYVVFGKAAAWGASTGLGTIGGANGFTIAGQSSVNMLGYSVAAAGDVNGDGVDDFLLGAPFADGFAGKSYLVLGHTGGWGSGFSLATLSGDNGASLTNPTPYGYGGASVSGGGDLNGDGFDDFIVGVPYNSRNHPGAAYVVFGKAGGIGPALAMEALNGNNGFLLQGVTARDVFGRSVSGAGDINGDGVADLIVGAPGGALTSGVGYVVFGGAGLGASGIVDVATLDGSNGFKLTGPINSRSGYSVAGVGDINGDGVDDLAVSGNNRSYVVFGSRSGFAAATTLASLNGANGFVINAGGLKVASAGDVNGDGIADLMVSSDPNQTSAVSYVIFGRHGFSASFDVATLNGQNGFKIAGGGDALAAGDFNGDGFSDVAVGAFNATLSNNAVGAAYVIFGHAVAVSSGGTGGDDITDGGALADTLSGGAGSDTLYGLGDNDTLSGGVGKDVLYGGDGIDSLDGGAEGDWLDGGIGGDSMTGGTGDDSYVVDDAGDTVIELGGEGNDVVHASITWTMAANVERLILDGTAGIGGIGNGMANTMMGNDGANTLDGAGGEDVIKGGLGADSLLGGDGNDLLYGGDGADSLDGQNDNDRLDGGIGNDTLAGGSGNDILDGGADHDPLDGGMGNDQLQGGAGVDILTGGDGNDVLDGGVGADGMTGGLGDDIFYVDDAGDTTVELAGQGTDLIRASVSWLMGANIENMILDGAGNIDGIGNGLDNAITGNAGNNILDGGAGDDVLKGMNGADTLIGRTGSDILVGGAGADTFVVRPESIHTSGAVEVDTVNDLVAAQGDRLDLSAIDADSLTAGNQGFHLVGSFSHHAAEMTLTFAGGNTLLALDVDGDGRADYRMTIVGNVTGDSGGWLL
jgi:Ca2+-binding RTX toxin-like protein